MGPRSRHLRVRGSVTNVVLNTVTCAASLLRRMLSLNAYELHMAKATAMYRCTGEIPNSPVCWIIHDAGALGPAACSACERNRRLIAPRRTTRGATWSHSAHPRYRTNAGSQCAAVCSVPSGATPPVWRYNRE
jgi:hypothetical protein